ncbi:MAG: hypothetical protein KR126chlam5_01149 [Candidatus Anoxychlamydiales bacterium]|nr:hypothetical protein [Candidatus Anoxychlamydiales bacterium]
MFTCLIRYVVDHNKREEFEKYACTWMRLIEKYGGIHHGYFLPVKNSNEAPNPSFSFPGIGENGPSNVAVALFSFSSLEKYEAYRKEIKNDEESRSITAHFKETQCFVSYERSFLQPLFPDSK